MRVLVTGAAGFLGKHVSRHAADLGCEVAGLGGAELSLEEQSRLGLAWHRPAMIDENALRSLPFRPDIVVHCAGGASVGASVSNPELDWRKTVGATNLVVAYLVKHAPDARLVYPSSGAVYGAAADALPRDLSGITAPLSPYGWHKAQAETVIRNAASEQGLKVCIVRLFSIFGTGLRKQLLWDACQRFVTGHAVFDGNGSERRDFLHIDDAVRLLWLGASQASAKSPTADGGSGKGTPVADLLTRLAANFDPRPIVQFSGTQRTGDPIDMIADIRAARNWGWRPEVELDQGLAVYADWFSSVYEILRS